MAFTEENSMSVHQPVESQNGHILNYTPQDFMALAGGSMNLTVPAWYEYADFHSVRNELIKSFKEGLLTHTQPFIICLISLYSCAFIGGFIGNLLVILVVMRDKHMRSITNIFLVNLAIGDLLVVILCLPFTLATYIYREWIYGEVVCKLTPFVQGSSVSVSVLTLLVISLNRFFAIHKPLKAKLIFSQKRMELMLAVIWLVSLVLSSPVIFINEVQSVDIMGLTTVIQCKEQWDTLSDKQTYNICVFTLLYILPVLCMGIAYCMIGKSLWYNSGQILDSRDSRVSSVINNTQSKKLLCCRRKVVRMLISLVIIFSVSWLPYHIINIYLDFHQMALQSGPLALYGYPLAQWLALSNSAFNPICYCFLSKSFRDAFCKAISRCTCILTTREHSTDQTLETTTFEKDRHVSESSTKSSSSSQSLRRSWRSLQSKIRVVIRHETEIVVVEDPKHNGNYLVYESVV